MVLSRELQSGKAAEHIVCGDLILQGFNAFLTDQGLPYDIIVDTGTELRTIQVKSTLNKKIFDSSNDLVYRFHLRHGKGHNRRIDHTNLDYIACIALDTKKIAYIPISFLLTKNNELITLVEFKDREIVYNHNRKPRQKYSKFIDDHSVFPEQPVIKTEIIEGETV